jgi:hypothetical protein
MRWLWADNCAAHFTPKLPTSFSTTCVSCFMRVSVSCTSLTALCAHTRSSAGALVSAPCCMLHRAASSTHFLAFACKVALSVRQRSGVTPTCWARLSRSAVSSAQHACRLSTTVTPEQNADSPPNRITHGGARASQRQPHLARFQLLGLRLQALLPGADRSLQLRMCSISQP